MPNEIAEKRVALKPTTFNQIRAFAQGFDGTQDDAIAYLLSLAVETSESEYEAGRRHRQRMVVDNADSDSDTQAPGNLQADAQRELQATA